MKTLALYLAALAGVDFFRHGAVGNPAIRLVTADSRQIVPGAIYVAIPGTRVDGHQFIGAAIAAGAAVVIHRDELVEYNPDICYFQLENPRLALSLLLREYYSRPDEQLKLAGVTGTNGKTTTASLIYQLLELAGVPGGLLSTIDYRTPKRTMPATHTTPDAAGFYAMLAAIAADGGRHVAMELSSHALDQYRTAGVKFRAGVFTNLTGDHLDYHGDMAAYFAAKRRLFTDLLAKDGTAVINVDDEYGKRLAGELPAARVISFGQAFSAAARIAEARLESDGSEVRLDYRNRLWLLRSKLIGLHNVYNLIGALLAAEALGIDWELLVRLTPELLPAPGRLEPVRTPENIVCYIDYAHTDDALASVLATLRPLCRGKLILVFGCGGDRDRTKRPRMGLVAAAGADLVIVSSDNPRSEAPESIIDEIVRGIPAGSRYEVEPDRRAAIRLARRLAGADDVILIAGKGHENYQEIKGVKHPFDDREEALLPLE